VILLFLEAVPMTETTVSGVEPYDVTNRPPCGNPGGEPTTGETAGLETIAQCLAFRVRRLEERALPD
jgi:hypothetical protein